MTPTNAFRIPANRGSHHSPFPPTPIPSVNPQAPNPFDTSLFSLDASGPSSLSQPYQPALPVPPTSSGTKRPYSPSLLPVERPTFAQGHSPTLSVVSPQSSTTTNNYYYPHLHMQESFSTGGSSNFSPNAPSHLSGDGSPVADMQDAYGDGFNEHTTPDFEEVEMPPLADDDVYEVDDGIDPYTPPPATSGRGGYPPSPRATKSPSLKGATSASLNIPGAGGKRRIHGSPVVKVEQFTPAHSANGANGVGVNVRPVSLSCSTSISSGRGDTGAATKSPTVKRGEDGAWVGGLGPLVRSAPGNDGELLWNLKDQTIQAAIEVKNAEIQDWLTKHTDAPGKDGRTSRAKAMPGGLATRVRKQGAKCIADFKAKQDPPRADPAAPTSAVTPGEVSTGNFTRLPAADAVDDDSSDDSSVASSFIEGSLDDVLDDDESMNTSEAPPTEEDLKKSELEAEEEQRRLENDPAFFPKPRQFYSAHPWNDTAGPIMRGAGIAMKNQPHTANAAMMKFQNYADNIETASRVATFGSQVGGARRLSSGDADKTLVESGLLKRLSFGRDREREPGHQRRSSLWGQMVRGGIKKGFGAGENKGKEGADNDNEKSGLGDAGSTGRKRGDSTASSIASSIASGTHFGPLKQTRSWSKGSLKVDTSVPSAFAQMAGIGAGIGKSSAHTPSNTSPAPPEKRNTGLSMGVNVINKALRRPRSRSELGTGSKLYKSSKPAFGIVGLLGQYGGPPTLPIKSPVGSGTSSAGGKLKPSFTFGEESRGRGIAGLEQLLIPLDPHRHDGYDDDDDDDMDENGNEAVPATTSGHHTMGTRLPKLNITPNIEGFAAHIRESTPNLHPKLIDRIGYEQMKRYKKLVEYRQKHLAAIENGERCTNGAKCGGSVGAIGAGGQEEGFGHRRNVSAGSYEGEGEAYSSDDSPTEAVVQFPPGVPQPPVSRLPAEFECPICFKVKKFTKPSDWTKHVHEDVHPFTCTFPECTEPKSFKRKADWVRHENERHRHLEWWTCNLPDCAHTCYRKDNFVQHLVREHKMVEPKFKARKAAARAAGKAGTVGKKGKNKAAVGVDGATRVDFDRVWQIVDDCHKTTAKKPTGEKCRFCGEVYLTWKKLTVHLAGHMEAISLPVLDLISDDSVVPPNPRSSGNRPPRPGCTPITPMPKVQLATDMDIDPVNCMFQRQQPTGGEYEEALPQNTYTNPSYTHPQQTPPRSSPHLLPSHQFNIHTPPHLPQYPINVNGGNLGYSPEHNIPDFHPGLHSTLNHSFEYELYPSPASTTQAQATSVNGGYSPSPTYVRQLHHSPPQRPIPGAPHLHVQQQQPGYYVYGQASGQAQVEIGAGVGQVHSQVVAAAHSLAHGLIEDNNGQYPLYAGGTEIPMGMMGMVETGDSVDSQYLEYMLR